MGEEAAFGGLAWPETPGRALGEVEAGVGLQQDEEIHSSVLCILASTNTHPLKAWHGAARASLARHVAGSWANMAFELQLHACRMPALAITLHGRGTHLRVKVHGATRHLPRAMVVQQGRVGASRPCGRHEFYASTEGQVEWLYGVGIGGNNLAWRSRRGTAAGRSRRGIAAERSSELLAQSGTASPGSPS